MQMLSADVVKVAVNAALEQRECRFDRVAMNPAGSCVFARAMIRHVVLGDWALDHMASIDYRTIGHEVRISRDVLAQNGLGRVRRGILCESPKRGAGAAQFFNPGSKDARCALAGAP